MKGILGHDSREFLAFFLSLLSIAASNCLCDSLISPAHSKGSNWYIGNRNDMFFCCVVLLRSQCPDSDSFLFWVHFDIISPTDDGWLSIDDLNILWLAVLAQPSSQLLSSAAPCAQSSDDISALNLRLIWAWSFFSSLWVRDARNNAADSQNT